jgi:Zn-dependent M28 family amino/carboxypeptidase
MINFKFILVLLIFASSMMTVAGLVSSDNEVKKVTEFKYLPRSFKEEQDNPVPLMDIYYKLFNNGSPWVNNFTDSSSYHDRDSSYASQDYGTGDTWGHSPWDD